ncbi:MAG TPA: hypothetical protein PK182_00410 [Bacillota bacterium]|nr:hypothetical protein [Bacillota bacterium]HOH09469.1 hypothetical protein [Bacillota bacterium]
MGEGEMFIGVRDRIKIAAAISVSLFFLVLAGPVIAGKTDLVPDWVIEGVSTVRPALTGDGGALAMVGGALVRISKDGSTVWRWDPGKEAVTSIAGDGAGGAWVSQGRRISKISPAGKLSWTYVWEQKVRSMEPLPDGRIAVASERGAVLISSAGKFLWLYDPATGCDT